LKFPTLSLIMFPVPLVIPAPCHVNFFHLCEITTNDFPTKFIFFLSFFGYTSFIYLSGLMNGLMIVIIQIMVVVVAIPVSFN